MGLATVVPILSLGNTHKARAVHFVHCCIGIGEGDSSLGIPGTAVAKNMEPMEAELVGSWGHSFPGWRAYCY